MIGRSPFGLRLWRLLSGRRPTVDTSVESMAAELAREASVSSSELDAVIRGAEPSPALIRQLGPALGIHTADMFVIAGMPVPQDLASAWPTTPWNVGSIVKSAVQMDAEQRRRLHELIQSLPAQPPPQPAHKTPFPRRPEPCCSVC